MEAIVSQNLSTHISSLLLSLPLIITQDIVGIFFHIDNNLGFRIKEHPKVNDLVPDYLLDVSVVEKIEFIN